MDRQDVLREVHRKLINPDFARRFTTTDESGSRPIVVAMLDDTIADLAERVVAAGGSSNVVTPFMSTLLIYTVSSNARVMDGPQLVTDSTLDRECTVGLFIARVAAAPPGGREFHFFTQGPLPEGAQDLGDDPRGLVVRTPA